MEQKKLNTSGDRLYKLFVSIVPAAQTSPVTPQV